MDKIIVANWKLNPESFKDASKFLKIIKDAARRTKKVTTIIAPPTIFLRELSHGNRSKRFLFSAQDMHQSESGAEVGETSPKQIIDAKVSFVLIGHSARRENCDTNEQIQEKVFSALKNNLHPILFVGESQRDDDAKFLKDVEQQIKIGTKDVPTIKLKDLILVYEPVWAISSKQYAKKPSAHEIHQMILFLKKVLAQSFDSTSSKRVRILYGGSVDETNIKEILEIPELNGVVLGSAGLDSDKFKEILKIADSIN